MGQFTNTSRADGAAAETGDASPPTNHNPILPTATLSCQVPFHPANRLLIFPTAAISSQELPSYAFTANYSFLQTLLGQSALLLKQRMERLLPTATLSSQPPPYPPATPSYQPPPHPTASAETGMDRLLSTATLSCQPRPYPPNCRPILLIVRTHISFRLFFPL